MRLPLVCVAAFAAFVLAGQAAAAPEVQIVRIRALAPAHGPGAGRVALFATVRYRPTRGLLIAAPNPSRTVDIGRLDVTVEGARVRDADHLVRASGRPLFYTHRVVLGPLLSAGALALGRLAGSAQSEQIIRSGRSAPAGTPRDRRRFDVPVRHVSELPAAAPPVCERTPVTALFSRRTLISVVCMGEGVRVKLAGSPEHGTATLLRSEAQRSVLAYEAEAGYVGPDRIPIRAGRGGRTVATAVPVDVQPFKLRALGDSATAGFGYLADGTLWGVTSLPSCIPPSPPNNRCSSNSPNGVGSINPVGWLPDFGLSNNVSWAAQFATAHGLTGAGQYANWAVSGSTPSDWASGYLNDELQHIASDRPDLVVMTLGGNPLLDTFLFGGGLQCVIYSGQRLAACVQSFVDKVGLVPNLQSVFRQLLAAQGTRVVASQYHLAVPASSLYSVAQLEVMFDVVNANIASAAQGIPAYGSRLFVIAPPRFDVGLGPGSYKCVGRIFTSEVDGPSRQATVSQYFLAGLYPTSFCFGDPWIISADSGIHPNVAGQAQFAQALSALAEQQHLLP